jgi:hypothetical protein
MFGLFKTQKKQKQKSNGSVKKKSALKKEDNLSNAEILQAIGRIQKDLDRLKLAVTTGKLPKETNVDNIVLEKAIDELKSKESAVIKSESERIIEGVFDGQSMVGADGQYYDVPANYASKSKLVEGDILKLTINNLGAFVFKQIKPIERIRKVGILEQDFQNLQYYAVDDGKKWKLLTASVTYFKGEPGDEVIYLIPSEGGSSWAAVENIVKA